MSGKRTGPDLLIHYWDAHFMMPLCMAMLTSSEIVRDAAPITCTACSDLFVLELGLDADGVIHLIENTGDRRAVCRTRDYELVQPPRLVTCLGCLAGCS